MRHVPLLVGTSGALEGKRFQVTERGILVGRDESCEVTIPDDGVSREHAKVLLHNAGVWLQDAGSRNGVFVNGKRVLRPKQLNPGDELSISGHTFSVELAPRYPEAESSITVIPSRPAPPMGRLVAMVALGLVVFAGLAAWIWS